MKNVIITILAMLVLGLGGYLVYDKVVVEDKINDDQNIETNNKKNNATIENNNDYKIYSNNSIKKLNSYYNEISDGVGPRKIWKHLDVNDFVPETSLSFKLETNGEVYAELDSRFVNSEYENKILTAWNEFKINII